MHKSVKLDSPVEFINITPLNPLISRCEIKVCYVSDEPNRNRSVITKEVAKDIANSIPGCPIVGFYKETNEDFEEHNKTVKISNGEIKIEDATFPYGFVDLNAKVWFQKFKDDDSEEREYLMTEGYLWTGQYPDCQRVINKGNNQSMELDPETLEGNWSIDENGNPSFFIINKAIMSKLCILGEDMEPCFEGSQIAVNFSLSEDFEEKLFSMMNELKDFLTKGGEKLFNRYSVELGNELWNFIFEYLNQKYPDKDCEYLSTYIIDGVFEDEGQKFAVVQDRYSREYFRLDINFEENDIPVFSDSLLEVTKTYVPAETPQFSADEVEAFELEYAKKKEEEKNKKDSKEEDKKDSKEKDEKEEDMKDEEEEEEEDFACGKGKKKSKYTVEELEYRLNELQEEFDKVCEEKNTLEEQVEELNKFKLSIEKEKKQEMINSFYMLSNEDKKDVIDNIDSYSLEDIEAKLSIICVRNKVNFNLDEEVEKPDVSTTFNLDQVEGDDTPAWIQAAIRTAEKIG